MKVERLTDEEIRVWRDQDALEFTDFVKGAREIIPRMLDEVERARALLRRIEWGGMTLDEWDACPECRGTNPSEKSMGIPGPYGHKPGCELAALIGAPTLPKSADRP